MRFTSLRNWAAAAALVLLASSASAEVIQKVANGGTGATTASGARNNLGLEIGADVSAFFDSSAELAAILGDKTGFSTGALSVFNLDPELVGATFTGSGTGIAKLAPWASNDSWYALGLSGVVGASTYNLRSHPSTPHLEINVPSGYEIRLRTADTIRAVLDGTSYFPSGAMSLGKLGTGWDGVFVDSSSSTNTGAFVGGSLTANRTYTTQDADGTLAFTSDIAATVTKAFVDALNVAADTLDGIDSTGFSLASHNHDADYSPIFTDSAGLAALLSDEQGSGGGFVRATSPTLTTPDIGAATGTSLDLATAAAGDVSLAQTRSIWFGGVGAGSRIRQNASANMVFSRGGTDYLVLAAAALTPNAAGATALGSVALGYESLFLDEAGAGTQTAQIVAPTLASDIVLTTPAATGTLATLAGTENFTNKTYKGTSLNLTLGGTELALGTGEVAMFTNRAAAADDAFLGVNAGSGGDAGFRTYHDGTESFRINSTTGGFGIAPNITTDPSAEFIGVAGASGFWRFRDGSATALLNLDFATNIATMLRYNVASTPTALSNGANSNITLPATGFMYVTGPTGAFNITGIVPPSDNADGYVLRIFNSTTQNMTLTNDATSTAANRILTLTGADVAGAGVQMATLIYSTGQSRWLLAATQG
jgi:hypothetical protein